MIIMTSSLGSGVVLNVRPAEAGFEPGRITMMELEDLVVRLPLDLALDLGGCKRALR
jgi:hypothetical protein